MNQVTSDLYDKLTQTFYSDQTKAKNLYLFQKLKKPLAISLACLVIVIFSLYKIVVAFNTLVGKSSTSSVVRAESHFTENPIYIDISGAVVKPATYKVSNGTRLFQVLERAGGLSPEADRAFIQRNYNLAVVLKDQQKVHFPSVFEVKDGYFAEKKLLVSLESSSPLSQQEPQSSEKGKISINTATQSQLEALPGVGPVTAQRIMAGRPYTTLEDLKTQDIIKDSVYQEIIGQLDL